jgi:hypothetical protein
MTDRKPQTILAAIKEQLEKREKEGSKNHSSAVKDAFAYLSYLAWHCQKYATIPTFLDAIRSDVVAALYAFAAGLERSAYLHARSLLENLLRHCYYDANPTAFVIQYLKNEADIEDRWSDLSTSIKTLPQFNAIDSKTRDSVFAEVQRLYKESCRFVHGPTYRSRSNYEGIGSIDLDKDQTEKLGELLRSVAEIGLTVLALMHLGPYMLISQPIRRYMLTSAMGGKARELFLQCMREVPFPWAKHQRDAALQVWRERKHAPLHRSEGFLHDEQGNLLLLKPNRS